MMKRLALIGTKDYAQSLIDIVTANNLYDVVGYIEDFVEKGKIINGYPVLGKLQDAETLFQEGVFDFLFIAIGYSKFDVREVVYNTIKGKIPLANIISKTAFVHPTAQLGEGILLTDEVYVGRDAVIEDDVSITLRSIVNHGCTVKTHTFFSTNVSLAGNVVVGKKCFIGVGCVISDGIKICNDTWLSPGLVVVKSIKKPGHYMSISYKLIRVD